MKTIDVLERQLNLITTVVSTLRDTMVRKQSCPEAGIEKSILFQPHKKVKKSEHFAYKKFNFSFRGSQPSTDLEISWVQAPKGAFPGITRGAGDFNKTVVEG